MAQRYALYNFDKGVAFDLADIPLEKFFLFEIFFGAFYEHYQFNGRNFCSYQFLLKAKVAPSYGTVKINQGFSLNTKFFPQLDSSIITNIKLCSF